MEPAESRWKLANLQEGKQISVEHLPTYLQHFFNGTSLTGSGDLKTVTVLDPDAISHTPTEQHFPLHLLRREWLTAQLIQHGKCYPPLILERAKTYTTLAYDDLAAFDAFVVYTLCESVLSEEFVTDLEAHELDGTSWLSAYDDKSRKYEARKLKIEALASLIPSLERLGSTRDCTRFRSDYETEVQLLQRGVKSDDLSPGISNRDPHNHHSRREIYPWSSYEPDRNSQESVREINAYLGQISSHVEAKVTQLPAFDSLGQATDGISHQLGLFAKSDLLPGTQILSEKSLLTAIRPLEDSLCDACGQELEEIPLDDLRGCDGEDCDITFCSQDCKDRARDEYHRPAIPNSDSDSDSELNENEVHSPDIERVEEQTVESIDTNPDHQKSPPTSFCGNEDLSNIGRPTNSETPEWDLYFLLLTRTIAMSATQNTHPLQLPEIKYLWGDFNSSPFQPGGGGGGGAGTTHPPTSNTHAQTLPFSFTHDLQYALDYFSTLSLTLPTATPYSPHWLRTYDFWILRTLYAKFRGVANATQSTFDGTPEIASVHPGWCLANHSCAPNVRWTPKGTRRLFVRTAEERSAWGDYCDQGEEWMGIRAGEEIFSHYTDVRLSRAERQERLREVLGGTCRCERCLC